MKRAFFLLFLIPLVVNAESYAQWKEAHWLEPDRSDVLISGIQADPDQDGLSNGIEYKLGTNPTTPDYESPVRFGLERRGESQASLALRFSERSDRESLDLQVKQGTSPGMELAQVSGAAPLETLGESEGFKERRMLAGLEQSEQYFGLQAAESGFESSYVWWEAEEYSDTSGVGLEEHEVLSEGRWVNLNDHQGGQARFLEYEGIEAPEDGVYSFYVRKFWRHGPFAWSFDGGATEGRVTEEVPLIDGAGLRLHTVANWTYAGEVELEKGAHTLRIEVDDVSGAASFDAFVLTKEPFPFRGKYKPYQTLEYEEEGWFPWTMAVDPFEVSAIDLRYLNESVAGESGFIQTRGEDFVHRDTGEIIRFWGVNAGPEVSALDRFSAQRYARFLAKMGVNLVRIHGSVYDGSGSDFHEVNSEQIDRIHFFMSTLKAEGIYVSLSIYFPLWVAMASQDEAFPGYQEGERPFSIIFFDAEFQERYRNWWRALIDVENPYTGVPLKEDPAVFSLELVNEDSLMFWNFDNNLPDAIRGEFEEMFGDWLTQRYGSLDEAAAAWGISGGNGLEPRDDFSEGRAAFIPLWRIASGQESKRAMDTARFLTETQVDFYREHYAFLKEELGYEGLVYASNWITANDVTLGPLERYSYTEGDYIDRHGYFEPFHIDSGDFSSSYSLREGHRFRHNPALRFLDDESDEEHRFANPIFNINYNDLPTTISEVDWPMPNRFRADMPFLFSSFGRVQGLDGIMNFTSIGTPWALDQDKWSMHTPVIMAQWPAAALVFRKGYVSQGDVVGSAVLPLEEHLYQLKGSPFALSPSLDNLRDPGGQEMEQGSVHPLAFLTGRIKIQFADTGEFEETLDIEGLIDAEAKTLRSSTHELFWDYGKGFATMDTPMAQGITGALSEAGEQTLGDVSIESPMEYGTIWLVSLDEEPLSTSSQMLLLVMSEEKASGWEVETIGTVSVGTGSNVRQVSDVMEVTDLGAAPMLVKSLSGVISLSRADADSLEVRRLDQNGYRTVLHGSADDFELDPETVYYLIELPN